MGLRSNEERYEEVLRIWEKATNDVTDALQKNLDRYNPIFMMADSGARGSMSQIRQLAGMRGLIANTSGKTIEIPIRAHLFSTETVRSAHRKNPNVESIDRKIDFPAYEDNKKTEVTLTLARNESIFMVSDRKKPFVFGDEKSLQKRRGVILRKIFGG